MIKNFIIFILFVIYFLFDKILSFKEVSILCYHSVEDNDYNLSIDVSVFERQMKFLSANYYLATLDEVVGYIKDGKKLPKKAVAVTFDDGYKNNLLKALPILEKYNVPATIFVVGDIEKSREYVANKLEMLQEDDIKKLADSSLINIEYHSKSHKLVDTLSTSEIKEEIDSKGRYKYFAYPGGHYSTETISLFKKDGYKAAFTIKPGLVRKGDDVFLIKRNVIERGLSFWKFRYKLTKALVWYTTMARFIKKHV